MLYHCNVLLNYTATEADLRLAWPILLSINTFFFQNCVFINNQYPFGIKVWKWDANAFVLACQGIGRG